MKIRGIIKVVATLMLSFLFFDAIAGIEIATIVIFIIAMYAWLGEYIALWRAGAISEKKMDVYKRNKIQRIREVVSKRLYSKSGEDISNIRIHVVPSDDVNGTAYGFNNISITSGALEACDEVTLCAILSHEVSHVLFLDSVFNRIIFGDVTTIILGIILFSFVSVTMLWVIFFILVMIGICRGFISMFIMSGVSKGINFLFELIQRCVLVIYQVVIAAISRTFEYRADRMAVDLGFGVQLAYFLSRFADAQEGRIKSISEILYASHPATYLRIERIKQKQLNTIK